MIHLQIVQQGRSGMTCSIAGHNYGTTGFCVSDWGVLLEHQLSSRLSVQATEVSFHNKDLPLQRERQWSNLSGHLEGPVEPGFDHLEGAALHLVSVDRPKPE